MTSPRFRIFFDMDGVLVDFERLMRESGLIGGELKGMRGAYLAMHPIEGALDGIRHIMSIAGMYGGEVWLATKPPTGIPWAYADKVSWVLEHLPELRRRIILTHDKGLLGGPGDYLIDDRPHRANCVNFRGTLVRFGKPGPGDITGEFFVADWAELVPLMHSHMKAKHAPDICGNCDTALPRGCGGIFKDDGEHCRLNRKDATEDSLDDINVARGLLRLGPVKACEVGATAVGWAKVVDLPPMTERAIPAHRAPECASGCTGGLFLRDIAGPCQHECAKTPEFQERSRRDAEASHEEFRASILTRPAHGGYPGEVRPVEGEHAIGELAHQRMTPLPFKLVHETNPPGGRFGGGRFGESQAAELARMHAEMRPAMTEPAPSHSLVGVGTADCDGPIETHAVHSFPGLTSH